eukprot:GHVH01008101.1.p1 GENE.GHVH01008101.1~~GHVH01008101.1.p1  ORF type:complete len:455 (+),score=46.17 GHVH01008101.1:432-1796(+)
MSGSMDIYNRSGDRKLMSHMKNDFLYANPSKFDNEPINTSFDHSISKLTLQSSLSSDSDFSIQNPKNSRRRRCVFMNFDGTLIPHEDVIAYGLGLPPQKNVNTVYHLVNLIQLTADKVASSLSNVWIPISDLFNTGCNALAIQHLISMDVLKSSDDSDENNPNEIEVNMSLILNFKEKLMNLLSVYCDEIFVLLQKCNDFGRLTIVSMGGRFWIERMLNFMLEMLICRRVKPPRWCPKHFKLSDDDMYDLCKPGVSFHFPAQLDFNYPKITDDIWKIPCIYTRNKAIVFHDLVSNWRAKDVISIGDGWQEFSAATVENLDPNKKCIGVRRVHFGNVINHTCPDLSTAHKTLIRVLPDIEKLDGTTRDVIITVPYIRMVSDARSDISQSLSLVLPIPDAICYQPLPSIPRYVCNHGTISLVYHRPYGDDNPDNVVLSSYYLSRVPCQGSTSPICI